SITKAGLTHTGLPMTFPAWKQVLRAQLHSKSGRQKPRNQPRLCNITTCTIKMVTGSETIGLPGRGIVISGLESLHSHGKKPGHSCHSLKPWLMEVRRLRGA